MTSTDSFYGMVAFGMQLHFDASGRVNGFTGAAWRGLVGQVLHQAVCGHPTPVCTTCPGVSACVYANLFKPLLDSALQPFWLHGWSRQPSGWSVGIRWLGNHNEYAIGEWLGALASNNHGCLLGGLPARLDHARCAATNQLSWSCQKGWQVSPQALRLLPQRNAPSQCRVRCQTPLVSKHDGDPLFGALHTRLQRLIQQHGDGQKLPRPLQPWHCHVEMQQEQRMNLSKRFMVGRLMTMVLSDMDEDAWSMLNAGLELHAGGQTSMGCGQYVIEPFLPPVDLLKPTP